MSTKEAVLLELMRSDSVSGERLAEMLGVSRSAVWKAIAQLREDGHQIEAATNRGYRLADPREILSEAAIRNALETRAFGREIELHREIDSTNRRAKELAAKGAPHGMLVCARSQTGGRGRFQRSFHSPEDGGVYMSLILRPTLPAERAVMLTSMTAVAVARAIEHIADVQVKIKWVNDLYINARKVCGILCEAGMDFESGQLEYAVVGVGVNTARQEFPPELQGIATSVGNECGREISPNRLTAEICACMEAEYEHLSDGRFMAESRERSNVIGRKILVLRGDERFSARALDIDDQGGLVIETDAGVQTVRSGEISIRWEEEQ